MSALLAVAPAGGLEAEGRPGSDPRAAVVQDSASAVDAARDAQARFERVRLRQSPLDRWGSPGGACDVRVGRMCMRLEGGSDWWWPDEEAPELIEARERLLDILAESALAAPGDGWILGQRVVYLGEAGRWDEAAALAARCGRVEGWWCAALEGLALHARGRFVEARASFEAALAGMPPERAADWLDPRELLTSRGRDARERAEARGDSAAADRFWRVSDPLFLVPGNDRFTEHLARRVWAATREDARNPYALSWGSDLDRLLVRYGWEVGWERRSARAGSIDPTASAVGHQDPRGQSFTAPPAAWDGSGGGDPEEWNPGSRTRPRSSYAPAYAPTFLDLDVFVAVLPRGDSALLVVRVPGIPPDTTFHAAHDHPPAPDPTDFTSHAPRHGLFAVDLGSTGWASPVAGEDPATVARATGGGGIRAIEGEGTTGSLTLTVPAGKHVVSVESWAPAHLTAARMRRVMEIPRVPRDVLALSELLVARPVGPLPESLEPLLPHLIGAQVVAPGDTLRVAWEVHGLGWAPEVLEYTLSLREEAGGFFSRLGRAVGVVGDRRGVRLEWSESGPDVTGPVFRAVDLVVPAELEGGRYTLVLELATAGRNTVVSERQVAVR